MGSFGVVAVVGVKSSFVFETLRRRRPSARKERRSVGVDCVFCLRASSEYLEVNEMKTVLSLLYLGLRS